MNCEEVSNHLVDYFDKSLDTATMTRVATHVIACPHCHNETTGLEDVVKEISQLAIVDPPLGFAQRVMAHVRELEPKQTVWQRFFAPIFKTIPVSATAMVMVAGLAVFLYQKQPKQADDPVNLALQANSAEPVAAQPEPITQDRASVEARVAAPLAERQAKSQLAHETATAALAKSIAAAKPAAQRVEAGSAALKEEAATAVDPVVGDARSLPRRPVVRAQEAATGRESGRFSGDLPLGAGVALSAPPMILERARIPLVERIADIEYVVRRRGNQPRSDHAEPVSAEALNKASEAESPSPAAKRAAPASPRIQSLAEIRFYNVALEHFDLFKKELAGEANIETEARITGRDRDSSAPPERQLLIKVTILPADTSAR
jgi:hypothetical protein